jgi:prepilin-type N-terminal cleavage/methylation domain-containing protein
MNYFHSPKLSAYNSRNSRKGFTLVEFLVAMTLFSIIVSIAVGGFVRALRTQQQLVGLISANSNISLTMEQMSRELRTGDSFDCDPSSPPNCPSVNFINSSGQAITYRLNAADQTIERGVNGVFQAITAGNIQVTSFGINMRFNEVCPPDCYPARMTILISISPKTAGVETTEIHLQTTVSARNLGT